MTGSDHDEATHNTRPCACRHPAKVRADEHANNAAENTTSPSAQRDFFKAGQLDMLGQAIATLEHLHDHEAPNDCHKDALWNAITSLRALQDET